MRTINFDNNDIKEAKLSLVNQNLTSLQSAFLMHYITNIEIQNQQKDNAIDECIKYLKENSLFIYKYDDDEMFPIITDSIPKKYLLEKLEQAKGNNNG